MKNVGQNVGRAVGALFARHLPKAVDFILGSNKRTYGYECWDGGSESASSLRSSNNGNSMQSSERKFRFVPCSCIKPEVLVGLPDSSVGCPTMPSRMNVRCLVWPGRLSRTIQFALSEMEFIQGENE